MKEDRKVESRQDRMLPAEAASGTVALAIRSDFPALSLWWNRLCSKTRESGFIVSPAFDLGFFILSPLGALALGLALVNTPLNEIEVYAGNTAVDLFISAFIMAHLFITIFRSHCNSATYAIHPIRFTLVPIVLFFLMGFSVWALVIGSVLATFWDVYHSSMQTFGIGRIYDMKAGNDTLAGRRLDMVLNLYLYAGPIAAGATLMAHINDFSEFERVGSFLLTEIPAHVELESSILTWLVISTGIPFFVYYIFAYRRLARQGYRISYQKIALLVSTGLCSIYAWGFNSFGMAFFIMNFFHGLQYFAIIWWSEKRTIQRVCRLENLRNAGRAALAVLLAVGFGYGFFAAFYVGGSDWILSGFLVVSLMHFWYDGFIWSVRRQQV